MLLTLALWCLQAGPPLASQGQSAWTFQTASHSDEGTITALRELSQTVRLISGASIAVRSSLSQNEAGLTARQASELGFEGYSIRSGSSGLELLAGSGRAVNYAVSDILHDLGCRWFSKDAVRIPRVQDLPTLPQLSSKPAFEYREPFFREEMDPIWAVRNRVNGNFTRLTSEHGGKVTYAGFAHTFKELLPPNKYFSAHPDWYAEVNGRRVPDQVCLTSQGAREELTKNLITRITEFPDADIFSVSQNDNANYCHCADCKEEIAREGSPSGPLLQFVNEVAGEVQKRFPKVRIDTLAYSWSEKPPLHVRAGSNVIVRFAPIGACVSHALDDCSANSKHLQYLKGWRAHADHVYVWMYGSSFLHYLQPIPDFDAIPRDLRLFQKLGVEGVMYQGAAEPGSTSDMAELKCYLLAQLMWDPGQDPSEIEDDFLRGVYGPAAPQIREWLELVSSKQDVFTHTGPGDGYLDGAVAKGPALFARALAAVAGNDELTRAVQKAQLGLEYVILLRMSNNKDLDRSSKMTAQARKVLALLKQFGIEHVREGQPLSQFAKRVGLGGQ